MFFFGFGNYSGPKNKRRKQNDRRHTSRDRRAEYYEDSGSPHHEHSSSSGPREARYNDMAPKWVKWNIVEICTYGFPGAIYNEIYNA